MYPQTSGEKIRGNETGRVKDMINTSLFARQTHLEHDLYSHDKARTNTTRVHRVHILSVA